MRTMTTLLALSLTLGCGKGKPGSYEIQAANSEGGDAAAQAR